MTADVYIGDEAFTVDDDSKLLIHDRCGKGLFGDGQIAAHVCEGHCDHCDRPVKWLPAPAGVHVTRWGVPAADWRDSEGHVSCRDSDSGQHEVTP